MKLSEHVTRFSEGERPVGILLDAPTVLAQAVAATRFYGAFAQLADPALTVTADIDVTDDEWAIIRPLFVLYVERESVLQAEGSRMMGIEAFGRSSGEVAADITALETDLPMRAFCQPIITV
ncbi:hypothetical protein [Uliginosibacterium sediminicola]|uniref:Uncharacterized protein n=1 Tax=Uliginosibacterium sediminicola TaxID=2024550 RepID=A0ABU9YW62_9RHOO